MTDVVLKPGQNACLQAEAKENVRVNFSVTGGAPLRMIGVLLDEEGRAINPAPLLTWRTPGDSVEIKLRGETISAILHTAAVHAPIQSILFLVAPYAREFFAPNERIFAAIGSDDLEAMAIESLAPDTIMKTLALCEIYHHPGQGAKVRARSEWRHRELTTLIERLGVPASVITQQNLYPLTRARHDDRERSSLKNILKPEIAPLPPAHSDAANIKPTPADEAAAAAEPISPVIMPDAAPDLGPDTGGPDAAPNPTPNPSLQIIELKTPGAQERLSSASGKFGPIQLQFSWHQRLATRAAVKIDVGCFWELQDDQKGQLNRAAGEFGGFAMPPHAALDQTQQQSATLSQETLRIDGGQWGKIRRILFYAAILEGPVQWDALDSRIKLITSGQPEIHAELITNQQSGPVVPLLLLENRSNQLRVSLPGGCYDSHISLDSAFNFELGWQKNAGHKSSYETHELAWTPQMPRGISGLLRRLLFGSDIYVQAEDLMRTTVAAAALVLIADGRVTMEDRHHCMDALMRLPIGKYFAEFEVRETLEKILHDLKHQRKASEAFTLQLLAPLRGKPDARIVIEGMRKIAMLNGTVSIHEEHVVERLTRYLHAGAR